MERCPQKNAMLLRVLDAKSLLSILEDEPLQDNGHHLREENHPDEQQQKFGFEKDGDRPDRATEREGTCVPHEDLRRVRVEPEKSDQRAHHRQAVDRELARMLEVKNAEVP